MLSGSLVDCLGAGTNGVNSPTETVEGERGASQRGACATFSRTDPPDGNVTSTAFGTCEAHQLLLQICTVAVRPCGSARVENGAGSTSGANAVSWRGFCN